MVIEISGEALDKLADVCVEAVPVGIGGTKMYQKCKITKLKKEYNRYKVELSLTQGELLSLLHGMEQYGEQSPVGADVYSYLKYTADQLEEKVA